MNWGKVIIQTLLNKYESSATFRNQNARQQYFSETVNKLFEGYESRYTPVSEKTEFEKEIQALLGKNLIMVKYDRYDKPERITLNTEDIDKAYQYLGREPKKIKINREMEEYRKMLGKSETTDRYIHEQIRRLSDYKKAEHKLEEAVMLIKMASYLEHNHTPIYIRELSQAVLHDTKTAEGLEAKLFSVLKKYGSKAYVIDGIDDKDEQERTLFEEYQLYKNMTMIMFKGDGEIIMENGSRIPITNIRLGFPSEDIPKIKSIRIRNDRIVTIENLTAFNRTDNDAFYLFLSGYHNSAKRDFLKKIFEENPGKEWYHSGDLDPDGFMIYDHLRSATGIPFKTLYMDLDTLVKYQEYGKDLEESDIKRINSMLSDGKHEEIMQYMLTHKKLEQEILFFQKARENERPV